MFHVDEKITLNTWADIATRPSYISSVDPEECRHSRVTAVYSFGEKAARCGVSNCLEAHGQGFLVSISDYKETNVCEGCGQRLFSMAFAAPVNHRIADTRFVILGRDYWCPRVRVERSLSASKDSTYIDAA